MSEVEEFEALPVAVRVHTIRRYDLAGVDDGVRLAKWRPEQRFSAAPLRTLVFDCETTTDHRQRLLFGSYQLFIEEAARHRGRCVEEGLFYADDLAEIDPDGFEVLRRYVTRARAVTAAGLNPQLRLISRTEFVDELLWRWGYANQALIVGFNLPFDLTRLALAASPARGRNRGGISLRLWEHNGAEHPFRPRIVLRNIDRHRTLIQFASTADRLLGHYRGRFLDLRTLAFAHTDTASLSLETASEAFSVPYEKRDVEHGTITADYITYCREDVTATVNLLHAATGEHRRHPIELPAHRAFSAATIGKSYWRSGGIAPTVERHPELPAELHGWGMAAFFGGRAECRVRRVDVPVTYLDFRSMYMTVNALMNTWALITAEYLRLDDVTPEITALLTKDADALAEQFFDLTAWEQLHTLVEIEPNGATLPVRAKYDTSADTWGIGVNPYRSTTTAWYSLADLVAAVIAGGPAPIVRRAHRFAPQGRNTGLRRVRLRDEIELNTKTEDFYRAVVEHRHRSDNNPHLADTERDRITRFLKVLANATGFGILAQYDRQREPDPVTIDVHTPHGAFTTTTTTPEDPGDYCFPALGAAITAAARLMLALLEHHVTQAGGTYAFCDTDSMAIIATRTGGTIACLGGPHPGTDGGGAVTALSWQQVDDIIDEFARLNPYNPAIVPGSILRIEKENYAPNQRQRELRCYAISAKRYLLATTRGEIVKRSEHGLGHLLNPDPDNDTHWIDQAWHHLRNPHGPEPSWLDQPALSKITITSAEMHAWFTHLNRGHPYADQIKPGNFLLLAHPDPLDPHTAQPVAPYNPDPTRWANLPWIDRNTGQPVNVTTRPADGTHHPDTARIHSYRDILHRYRTHPETKALDYQNRPVTATTVGLLRRRPVEGITPTHYIGKETNNLHDRALGLNTETQSTTNYRPADTQFTELVLPALRTIGSTDIARHTGINQRTVQRCLAGTHQPRPDARQQLTEHAIAHARQQLADTSRHETAERILYRYLQQTRQTPNPD